MDCFETQNHMADWIDGTLANSIRGETETHLKSCDSCIQKIHRMENLIHVMHSQPRALVPTELRTDPLAFKLPAIVRNKNFKTIWRELPLGARLVIEALSIAAVVITGIQVGPKIRNIYEDQMDKKLQSMIAAEDLSAEEGAPLARGKLDEDAQVEADFASDEGEDHHHAEINVDPNLQVGKSEVWRFNIKTDSPALVRTKIMKAFEEVGIKKETSGYGGIEAPGGIQFDLIVPQEAIPQLKAQLEQLAQPQNTSVEPAQPGLASGAFTWYKNRSKKPIPAGTSRMVIWLSQM